MWSRCVPCLMLVLALGGAGVAAGETARAKPAAAKVPIAESLRAIDPWIRSPDWTVRSLAALELRKHAESGAVFFATRMLASEAHPYAAACALAALAGRSRTELVMEGGTGLVDALFRFAEHPHPTVRQRARDLLYKLPPVKLGTRLEIYRGWWKRGREALRLEQASMLRKVAQAGGPRTSGDGHTVEAPDKQKDLYAHLTLLRARGLELCIVMDHTGSMGSVIGAAKSRAVALVRRLSAFLPKLRTGLVTYDDAARLRIPLIQNAQALLKAFSKVSAGGGGDMEEGVDKGLRLALTQEVMGWSRGAQRVIVIVGDAPPHDQDVARMMRDLQHARADEMYDVPVIVHMVSTNPSGVEYFSRLARVGGGSHVTLRQASRLVDELILLSFGGSAHRAQILRWIEEIEALRKAEPR